MWRKIVVTMTLFAFLLYLGSCTSMMSITMEKISEEEHPSKVWVKTVEGTRYKISEPAVRDSMLTGTVEGEGAREFQFSEIESIQVKKLSQGKTLLVCAAGVTGTIMLASILSKSTEDSTPSGPAETMPPCTI